MCTYIPWCVWSTSICTRYLITWCRWIHGVMAWIQHVAAHTLLLHHVGYIYGVCIWCTAWYTAWCTTTYPLMDGVECIHIMVWIHHGMHLDTNTSSHEQHMEWYGYGIHGVWAHTSTYPNTIISLHTMGCTYHY